MSGFKKILVVLLGILLAVSVVSGIIWHTRHYVTVDFRFYPKGAESLDLRGESISISHYERLRKKMPDCHIQWSVPFQGRAYPEDTRELTVTSLAEGDLQALAYLPQLKTVQAEGCTDYANLLALRQQYPQVTVNYSVELCGELYSGSITQALLDNITAADVALLSYLPELETVACAGGEMEAIGQIQAYCQEQGIAFALSIGGDTVPADAETVAIQDATEEELSLLQFLTQMKRLHISLPQAPAESLLRLRESRPDVTITWEQEICGKIYTSEAVEIDLSHEKLTDLAEAEQAMAYFPDAEILFLGKCGIANETLAAHRERLREKYKLVWTVRLGDKLTARTDDTTFMPVREHVYYFNDEEAYNLRYCEDMVCIDIGHMSIHNIDFVAYMPDLQYLILAHTQLQYIDPISNCKKLKFLELDWSPIQDYTPLLGCMALEDLNLGNTYADFAPILKMTWLKNLWLVNCSRSDAYKATQALTDTYVMTYGDATVANGWRDLPNYYAMRDVLGMGYMSW